jgi:hypothetical protein
LNIRLEYAGSAACHTKGGFSMKLKLTSILKEQVINTSKKVSNDGVERLPYERDEAPDGQDIKPKEDMKQAYDDLQKGLVDTDLHGIRGVEAVVKQRKRPAKP